MRQGLIVKIIIVHHKALLAFSKKINFRKKLELILPKLADERTQMTLCSDACIIELCSCHQTQTAVVRLYKKNNISFSVSHLQRYDGRLIQKRNALEEHCKELDETWVTCAEIEGEII